MRWIFFVALALAATVAHAQPHPPWIPNPVPPGNGGTGMISITQYGASVSASDNQTAIQNAINAAVAANVPLFIPADTSGACYKYTAPLTISGNLSIVGSYVSGNWAGTGHINVPGGSPMLSGSVICPSSNGSNAITISGTSLQVNIRNLGILFQTMFIGTGDGINYVPSGSTQGLSGAVWNNVWVAGHDGNHYAFNLKNPIYGWHAATYGFGGGLYNLYGDGSAFHFGNMTFIEPYGQVIVGGSANGFTLAGSALSGLNLMTFIRPQAIVNNLVGVTPGGNPPTSAQQIWSEDSTVTAISAYGMDLETNVSSPTTFGKAAQSNYHSFDSLFMTSRTVNAPSWGVNGLLSGPVTFTLNDTTTSGALTEEAASALPGWTLTGTNSMSLTNLTTLYLGLPVAGTNVSTTRTLSLHTVGGILADANITSSGLFTTGTVQLNTNGSSNTTAIGNGTTSGQVTIGGGSNKTAIASPLMIGSSTPLTLSVGEIGMAKIAASGAAPGAAGLKLGAVCGTNAGSMKIIAYAGTSTTPVTVVDNVGSGVTGC